MAHFRFSVAVLAALGLAGPAFADDLLSATRPVFEAVDHYVDLQLKEQGITPAPLADDATLLRRLTLDLAGRIPTSAELRQFLASKSPTKKVELVDRLLSAGAFARHQANEFDVMLSASRQDSRKGGTGEMREYLLRALKDNKSWDRIFRDLIVADEKDPVQKGARQFLLSRVSDQDRLTNDVSVAFFGINVSCAQCHDHPLVNDWKQDHYYGMKSFFARTYAAGQFLGERDYGVVQFKTTKNVTRTAKMMFLTGKVVPVKEHTPAELKKLQEQEKKQPKGGKGMGTPPPPPEFSARAALVDLVLQPEQREYFASNIVNRVWHRLFGQGLVTPVDQMHSANLASHPELLSWLSRDIVQHNYDLKHLIRGLVLSNAYARSSRYEGERWPAARTFAVAKLRPLTPMQMAVSLRVATADPEQFPATLKADELDRKMEQLESASRGFASLFEQPRDDFQISVTEALLFSNSDRIQREILADGTDRLLGRLKNITAIDQGVDLMMRNILARMPTTEENRLMTEYLSARRTRLPEGYRQAAWALLSGAEFRFNH